MPPSACIRPDDDAASSVAANTRMMQQAQPKSAATRANAATVRSPSWPIQHGWNIALYQVGRRGGTESGAGHDGPRLHRAHRRHLHLGPARVARTAAEQVARLILKAG